MGGALSKKFNLYAAFVLDTKDTFVYLGTQWVNGHWSVTVLLDLIGTRVLEVFILERT